MGIKNLHKFLRDVCPNVFEQIHISEYAFEKVAIDVSLYLYVYKARYGEEGWLKAFLTLVECLRKNELHSVFIYDTKAPPEKEIERQDRAKNRENAERRVFELETALEKYNESGEVDTLLLEFQKKRKLEKPSFFSNTSVNIPGIRICLDKMKRQIFSVTQEDFDLTKKMFDILDVPYFQAPGEAETTCAHLTKIGKVKGLLSRDSDVLAYGSPVFLTNLNEYTGVCDRICYHNVLKELELTSEQFLDFCIMSGTDYNKNIFKIGCKKAYNLIKKYGSIEEIEKKTNLNVDILNHERVREIFTTYEPANYNISYCGTPDFNKLSHFLSEHNLHVNMDTLEKAFTSNVIIFEE